MATTTITIHLPAHRRAALKIERQARAAVDAYDANIGAYLDFLREGAHASGYELRTDRRDDGPVFSIDETDHAAKKAAHAWLEAQPDIWNWSPPRSG